MAVAIENFLQLDSAKKVMILGDMFELGTESSQEHKAIINLLSDTKDVVFYFIGKEFYYHRMNCINFQFFETFETFAKYLSGIKIEDSSILIKGSRGMALERTLQFL
jgi:UDP-N-acetylmuramoyl-tripeptide--D-alanyl-D-alanine ligase